MALTASTKSKNKPAPASAIKPKNKFSTASIVGAPAQHNQGSRKGKRAWRKNVDIEDLEEKLEGLREEERTFGLTLQKKADGDLFVVDTKGDDKGIYSRHLLIVAISYPYFSFLSSKIFATLLPHYPEVTPNNISALCCPRCLCTPSTIGRQSTRKRAAAQNRTEGSQRTSE